VNVNIIDGWHRAKAAELQKEKQMPTEEQIDVALRESLANVEAVRDCIKAAIEKRAAEKPVVLWEGMSKHGLYPNTKPMRLVFARGNIRVDQLTAIGYTEMVSLEGTTTYYQILEDAIIDMHKRISVLKKEKESK
jgi:hypothetical protein